MQINQLLAMWHVWLIVRLIEYWFIASFFLSKVSYEYFIFVWFRSIFPLAFRSRPLVGIRPVSTRDIHVILTWSYLDFRAQKIQIPTSEKIRNALIFDRRYSNNEPLGSVPRGSCTTVTVLRNARQMSTRNVARIVKFAGKSLPTDAIFFRTRK